MFREHAIHYPATMVAGASGGEGGGFAALALDRRLLEAVTQLGYEEPTPIQREAIPPLLAGRDLVGQAATGTGKTAAFALPLLQRIAARKRTSRDPGALILVPTRELAMQVAEAVHRYGRTLGVDVLPVYGGQPFGPQLRALRRGVDVVVATPGRAVDHLRRGTLSLAEARIVVLDEADEMLDMGFADDLDALLKAAPAERQTVLFSATMPPRIAAIARRHLRDPVQLRIAGERPKAGTVPRVRQTAYVVARPHKPAALARILDLEDPAAALVFCRTRTEVDELGERLRAHGYRAEVLHGGMSQAERDRVMRRLRAEEADLVIATDVAARGLDVPQLTHVINYDVPSAPESYVHRIGRVGRAGREGVAITLVEPREHRLVRNIEQLTKRRIEIASVPTVANLRARRLEGVAAALRETLVADDVERYRVVVDALAREFDPVQVAMAAVKLLSDGAAAEAEEQEIPAVAGRPPRAERGAAVERAERAGRAGREDRALAERPRTGMTRIFIGGGRAMGLRPQDVVGAITGEAGIGGREIGAITISDRYALAEVPDELVHDVVAALRRGTVKGRKLTVRLERREDGGVAAPRGRARRDDDDRPRPRRRETARR
ncbi:MAG: DEAD/DEAH box helicase [Thermodesulfobacteriota bacterium]